MGKMRKKKGREQLAGREKGKRKGEKASPQFPPVLFSCLRFLNSADPTISEPGTGYLITNIGLVCHACLFYPNPIHYDTL